MSSIKNVNFNINPKINLESQSKRLVRLLSELNVITFPFSPKDEHKIVMKKFTDGLSNILVGIYHLDRPNDIIMVRIYGEAVNNLVDRNKEMETMVMLNSVGLSSKLYAKFENGFCYEYLDGLVLDTDLVGNEKVAKLTARSIAKLHTLSFDNKDKEPDAKLQESNLIKRLEKILNLIPSDLVIKPISKVSTDHDANNNEQKIVKGELLVTKDGLITKEALAKEVSFVRRSHLIRTEKDVVFCHNDLLPKNLILSKDQKKVLFIDLEYADYNGRAFELACHFLEYCGIEFDTSKYPSEPFIRNWIKNYCNYIKRINVKSKSSHFVPDEIELFVKVKMYSCIANLQWALWSLYMSSDPTMSEGFDYKDYAMKRLKDYYKRRLYLL